MGLGAKKGFAPWSRGFAAGSLVLPNPGWESGDAGGWTLLPGSAGGVAAVSSVDPRSGAYHLLLTKAFGGSQSRAFVDLGAYNSIPALRGRKIRFNVFVQAVGSPSTQFQIQINCINGTSGNASFSILDDGTYTAYKLASVTSGVIPATTTDIRLFLVTGTTGIGSWRVDDMSPDLI